MYANSIFQPDSQFISSAQLAAQPSQHDLSPEDVRSYVHIIFGLSKDWCASGLRVGCLWTLNSRVYAALQNISYFSAVSGLVQHMVAEVLEDIPFVDTYLKENLSRLKASYDVLAGTSSFSCAALGLVLSLMLQVKEIVSSRLVYSLFMKI